MTFTKKLFAKRFFLLKTQIFLIANISTYNYGTLIIISFIKMNGTGWEYIQIFIIGSSDSNTVAPAGTLAHAYLN